MTDAPKSDLDATHGQANDVIDLALDLLEHLTEYDWECFERSMSDPTRWLAMDLADLLGTLTHVRNRVESQLTARLAKIDGMVTEHERSRGGAG